MSDLTTILLPLRKKFKLVILGMAGTGKSSIMGRIIGEEFDQYSQPTIGAAFGNHVTKNNNMLEIWDTAGQERYRSLAPMYYRNASLALIVFDISDSITIDSANDWIDEMSKNNISYIVIGNKLDLYKESEHLFRVKLEAFKEKEYDHYIQMSAKTGLNLHQLMETIDKKLEGITPKDQVLKLLNLDYNSNKSRSRSCC